MFFHGESTAFLILVRGHGEHVTPLLLLLKGLIFIPTKYSYYIIGHFNPNFNRSIRHNFYEVLTMSRLKELRTARGLSQLAIQMKTNIDQSDYSKLENGIRNLSFEQCRQLALLLGTSMDYLAGLTDVKEPYPRASKYTKPV